jgi:hypothetical protein
MSLLDDQQNPLPTGDLSYQRSLFPVDAISIHRSGQNTADLKLIVTASNNKDYATKTILDGNGFVPASELFCYELATTLDIPTPEYSLISMPDESLAFGSLWEGGVHKISHFNHVNDILEGTVKVRDLKRFLSQVYGFDLFINNIDRHFGNYLFRESYQALIGLAFDYSRAWYEVNAYEYSSLEDSGCNTQLCHDMIDTRGLFDKRFADDIFDRLLLIPTDKIVGILKTIPDEWLSQLIRDEIAKWWGSNGMKNRIKKLKVGI